MEYEFDLLFKLPPENDDPNVYLDALYESGCDDALIGTGNKGMIVLSFARESSSATEAITSAIKNVKQAIPDAHFLEASPDYVSVSEIAAILGHTRQNTRKLLLKDGNTPSPVHIGKPSVWHLAEVLEWFKTQGKAEKYNIQTSLLDTAFATRQFNIARQLTEHDVKETRILKKLMA